MSVPSWDRELTIDDFAEAGKRVELHPATDRWMMGDRFGTVVEVDRKAGLLRVRLDKSGKTIFNPNRLRAN